MPVRDLYFGFPQAIFLFFIIPFLIFFMWNLSKHRQSVLNAYTTSKNLSQLVYPRSKIISYIKNAAWICAWALICLALMDPKGNLTYLFSQEKETEISSIPKRKAHDILFLIDTSASMSVPDANGQTRLNKAKEIADEIMSQLDGQTVAVYSFTSQLTQLVPPTLDYLFTRLMIQAIQINEGDIGGTDFKNAFETLKRKVFSHLSPKIYTLILLSDGGDQHLEKIDEQAKLKEMESIVASIPNPKQFNLHLFTIGIGSPKESVIPNILSQGQPVYSRLEATLLQQLAIRGEGKYYEANAYSAEDLARQIADQMQDPFPYEDGFRSNRTIALPRQENILYDLYYQIPLGLALVLLLVIRLLPDRYSRGNEP